MCLDRENTRRSVWGSTGSSPGDPFEKRFLFFSFLAHFPHSDSTFSSNSLSDLCTIYYFKSSQQSYVVRLIISFLLSKNLISNPNSVLTSNPNPVSNQLVRGHYTADPTTSPVRSNYVETSGQCALFSQLDTV